MILTVQKGAIPRELGNLNTTYQYAETGGYHRTLNYTYTESQKHTDSYDRYCPPYDNIEDLHDKIKEAVCIIPGVSDMLAHTPYPDSNNDPAYATWDSTPRTVTDPLGTKYTGVRQFQLKFGGSNIFVVEPSTGDYSPPVRDYESVSASLCMGMVSNYCVYSNKFDITTYLDASGNVKPDCVVDDARDYVKFAWDYIFIIAEYYDRQHPNVCTGVHTLSATTYSSTQGITKKVPSKNPMMDCDKELVAVTTFELTVSTS